MMKTRALICSTVCFLLSVTTLTTGMSVVESLRSLSAPLTNIVSFKGKIYVGGANMIYVLDKDLNIIQTASTCDFSTPTCNVRKNVNKVLLLNTRRQGKGLVICGSGNNGTCELRNLSNVELVISNSSLLQNKINYLQVSTDIRRPAQGVITGFGKLVLAVTFGEGMPQIISRNAIYKTYVYAISTRNLPDFNPSDRLYEEKTLRLKIQQPSINDYLIYYKASFQSNWMTYFVTNQKTVVGAKDYVSKLIRICQIDTGYSSYTDIVIQCRYDGVHYNLIQDAVLLNPINSLVYNTSSMFLVGAFTRGNDPENAAGDTVICVTELSSLDKAIMAAKKNYAISCEDSATAGRYLPTYRKGCIKKTDYTESFCNTISDNFKYVIGKIPNTMESSFKVSKRDGVVTTLHGTMYNRNRLVLILGTSTGKFIQANLLKDLSIEEYGRETVDGLYPIRKIYAEDDDTLYVMTSQTVFKYSNTNCSEYQSCAETIASRNPLCGWCAYRERSTRKFACPYARYTNHWLSGMSSIQNCVSMLVEPSGIPVINAILRVQNIPVMQNGDTYSCRFVLGSSLVNITSAVPLSTNIFSCKLPDASAHSDALIKLQVAMKTGATAVLSTVPLLFHECRFYRRCVECVSVTATICQWCRETATCQDTSTCLMVPISEPASCPKLLDNRGRYFIHDRTRTTVVLHAANLINVQYIFYKCIILSTDVEIEAEVNANSVSCPINIKKTKNVLEEAYRIVVKYGIKGDQLAEVNDAFLNFVTVYNCTELASNCSHCQTLNKTRYKCEWCENNQCMQRDNNCGLTKCLAPSITKVIPKDGPVKGGTRLTIFGTNFGNNISIVEHITVAGVPCTLNNNTENYFLSDNKEFETLQPTYRMICTTNATLEETSGMINVTIDGQSSTRSVEFAYKRPMVTAIYPMSGPTAGGTIITLFGKNLGIGNRHVSVILSGRSCFKPKVWPDLTLDAKGSTTKRKLSDSYLNGKYITLCKTLNNGDWHVRIYKKCFEHEEKDPVNYTIQCTVAGTYGNDVENDTHLLLTVDGGTFRSSEILYSFVTDPIVINISPKKGFVSGGTRLNVEGKYLDNAHLATLTIRYAGKHKKEECEMISSKRFVCKVPKASTILRKDISRQRTGTSVGCIEVTAILGLNGVTYNFSISYFRDPVIHSLSGDGNTVTLDSNNPQLNVNGQHLNLVATSFDIRITVGIETCAIINLTSISILCVPSVAKPRSGITGIGNPEVIVRIGNIHKIVGYVRYLERDHGHEQDGSAIILVSVVVSVLLSALAVGLVLICLKYRQMKRKINNFEKTKTEIELTDVAEDSRFVDAGNRGSSGIYADISEDDMISSNNKETDGDGNYDEPIVYLECRRYLKSNETTQPDYGDTRDTHSVPKETAKQSCDADYINPCSVAFDEGNRPSLKNNKVSLPIDGSVKDTSSIQREPAKQPGLDYIHPCSDDFRDDHLYRPSLKNNETKRPIDGDANDIQSLQRETATQLQGGVNDTSYIYRGSAQQPGLDYIHPCSDDFRDDYLYRPFLKNNETKQHSDGDAYDTRSLQHETANEPEDLDCIHPCNDDRYLQPMNATEEKMSFEN